MRTLLLSSLTLVTILGAQTKPAKKAGANKSAGKVATKPDAKKTEPKPLEVLQTPGVSASWSVPGFMNPESVLWDAKAKVWYSSNMPNGAMGREGKGFIAKLDKNGLITTKEWVKGLNAPKGLGLVGRMLYVADLDTLVAMDSESGNIVEKFTVPGAKFLNDIATSPEGDVYISDTIANAVFVLRKGAKVVEPFAKGSHLDGPNGLLVRDGALLMVGWGVITDPATFATRTLGRVHRFDLKTRAMTTITQEPLGNLDGIAAFEHHLLVTDYVAGKLFIVDNSGHFLLVKSGLQNPADLGVDPARNIVAIPEMGAGQITFLVLN